jgi:toxin ParE1/3/4
MAYKLIWSPASRDDLSDIVRFIARDNPQRAASFAYELMARTDALQQHPELGRSVPELRNPQIREIIFRPYRIVSSPIDRMCANIHAPNRVTLNIENSSQVALNTNGLNRLAVCRR